MKNFIFLIAAMALLSCKNDTTTELDSKLDAYDQLTEQTIEIHDELMNDMGLMAELESKIDERLEDDNIDEVSAEQFIMTKASLEDAHDAMMTWMKDYSEEFPYEAELPSTVDAINTKMPVLQQFHEGILEVQTKTENAIESAEGLLANQQ